LPQSSDSQSLSFPVPQVSSLNLNAFNRHLMRFIDAVDDKFAPANIMKTLKGE
jgi:hypothetical protein